MGRSTYFRAEPKPIPQCSQHLVNTVWLSATKKHGRYWIRTSDPFRVKEVRYHCANRPHKSILNHRLLGLRTEEMVVVRRVKT